MTLPEVLLWQELRGGKLDGLQFRRQHPVGPYILDYFCTAARLAVEVDGRGHDEPRNSHTINVVTNCWRAKASWYCALQPWIS
jgi:very-short-patch-repair endonuclease